MVICNCRETYYKTKSATLGWPSAESLVSHTYLYILTRARNYNASILLTFSLNKNDYCLNTYRNILCIGLFYLSSASLSWSIRIHNECEGRIAKIGPKDHSLALRACRSDDKR